MKTMAQWKRAGAVGLGLLAGVGAAFAQGDLPEHARIRLVAAAPRAGGGGQGAGAAEGAGAGQNAPVKDDLFAGTEVFEKNATGVQEITMDPDSLNMVGGPEGHRAHNMVLNVVRTYSYDKPGMYNMADVDAYRNKLNSGDWHCSVHTRDLKNGSSTDICSKRRTDGMKESAIITVEPRSLTFIHTIRKAGGPGESEMGAFPMMMGMPGLPAIAMMDPEMMVNLQMMLHGLPGVGMMPGELGMLKVMPRIDSEQMRKQFETIRPQFELQMKRFDKEMKDFDSNKEKMQKDFKFEYKNAPGAPDGDEMKDAKPETKPNVEPQAKPEPNPNQL